MASALAPKRRRVATENALTKLSGGEECALFNCAYCQKNISNVVRIRCAVCSNFELCVECFSVGAERQQHKAYHDYHVIDNMSFPLFTRDWGADEELLLLEAVEMFGLGNWTEVSEHVGTKTKTQCHAHYFEVYVKSPSAPLPDMSKILGKGVPRMTEEELKAELEQQANENKDKADEERAVLESLANPNAVKTEGNVQELTGYNVKRNEFDPEYDMDAELPLAEMEFRENDTEEDVQMKLRMIEIYNSRLQERARRKQFILERNLLNVKKQQNLEKKRSQYERDLHGTMRVFARFLSPTDYEMLLEGLAAEHRLRSRITELKEWRRNGIHTIAEGEDYDLEKRRRETEFARLRAIEHPTSKNIARANKFIIRDATQINEQLARIADEEKTSAIPTPRTPSTGTRRRMYLALDLTDLPGVDLLSEDEKELCTSCRLLPVHYLAMKLELMREGLKSETPLTRNRVRTMFKIDPLKAVRVYELLLQHGWVLEDGFTNPDETEDAEPASKKSKRDSDADEEDMEGDENGPDDDEEKSEDDNDEDEEDEDKSEEEE
ncbi:Zinc finger, ZZ-type [Ostreococcus tauri]|uniref:Transcriptional adapter n=1 Tax=Ostreococcus tauri TaxID=70448 RepID=A0A096P7D9_OSTTA|nr:Zinc finger, ZZ-type [Ostreococcus tauri]CEG00111.1 Zinc finger, ZZ-type [Ostreococcus tauri]|eukprot:XP_003082628.2 Zinc finger, ZZ-type [Ostreococcus tauri]